MTTKERILALLEENRGTPLSGEVLAEELGVSRTAVWKAIKDLQKAGHAIAAAQNRGYTLDTDSEVLSEQGVRLFLRNKDVYKRQAGPVQRQSARRRRIQYQRGGGVSGPYQSAVLRMR